MKKSISVILFLWCLTPAYGQVKEAFDLYVGTFTSEGAEGIYLCRFNAGEGKLTLQKTFKGVDSPNFLRISADGNYLYAATRSPGKVDQDGGAIVAYAIRPDKSLAFLNKQSSWGDDPCYVDVSPDGKWVAAANYGGGSVALFPVNPDGSLKPASSVVRHQGSGPNKTRQTKAYAHSIRFPAQGDLLYAADLGADKLFAYRLDKNAAKLETASPSYAELPPGSGPRHFEWSGSGKHCYVVNELLSTVTVFVSEGGTLREIQNVSALPPAFSGVSYCADIHLSPDGKYLYASNRGHNSIAVFSVEENGLIRFVTTVSVEGNWPRNFAIDPTGKFILVANQRSHDITVFRLTGGIPVFIGKLGAIPAPVCLEFLKKSG